MELLMLLSTQRSGTKALRSALRGDARIADAHEIFSGNNPDGAHVALNKMIRESKDFIPTKKTLLQFFERLHEGLDLTHARKTICILDTKYNTFGPFNPYGWRVVDEPFFLTFFKKKNWPILHLIRKDTIASYLSAIRAAKTGHWHQMRGDDTAIPDFSITLEKQTFLPALRSRVREKHYFRRIAKQNKRYVEIFYEDLFDANTLSKPTVRKINTVIGFSITPELETLHEKIAWDWRASVQNIEEMYDWIDNDRELKRHCKDFIVRREQTPPQA